MKRKPKRLLSLLLALVFTAAALAGAGERFSLAPSAEALDVSIDTGEFVIPEPDSCFLYHWKPGLPPEPENYSDVRYPLLITWLDQYYLCTDDSFAQTLNYRFTDDGIEKLRKARGVSRVADIGGEGWSERDEQEFDMGKNALLSTLGFYQSFKNKGYGVTFDFMLPEIPYVCYNGWNHYALGIPQKEGSIAFDHEYNWLVAQRTHWDGKNISGLNVRHISPEEFLDYEWSMPSDMPSTDGRVSSGKYTSVAVTLADIRNAVDTNSEVNPDIFKLWRFWSSSRNEGNPADVFFRSDGTVAIGHSKGGKKLSSNNLRTLLDRMFMMLGYDGSKFVATSSEGWTQSRERVFQVYYGEPDIVSIHHDSFTVAKGQVVNLDGPIILGPNCTVTVEDGGVLSCAGWVVNEGDILVKPGGTLLVQDRETKTEHSYGAITNTGVKPGAKGGRIACDGKMIVMRDCKVCGAGLYGLQFGSSAQVVNYGQLISENFQCFGDHTIENRGPDSAVYAGWGVTDGGYDLTMEHVFGSSFPGKGAVESAATVKLPANAIYGEGAERLYVNGARSVAYYVPEPRKGNVSGSTVLTPASGDGELPQMLPDSVQVYYDGTYNTYFVVVGGVTYHYNETVSRWVYIGPDGSTAIYNYTIRPVDDKYDFEGKLPGGYRLSDGRICYPDEPVGGITDYADVEVKYEPHVHVWWFTGDDGNEYYYESLLEDYIWIDENDEYYVYPEPVRPPEVFDSMYISSADYLEMSDWRYVRLYRSGMKGYGRDGTEATEPVSPPTAAPTQAPKPTEPVVTGPTPSPKPTQEPEETFAPFDGTYRAYRQKSTGKIYTVIDDGSILWYSEENRIFEGTMRNGAYAYVEDSYVDMSGVR